MKKCLFLMTGLILIAGFAFAANPATVGPSGDFTSIQAALESWCLPGGSNVGETPPFIINIDYGPIYDEALDLDSSSKGYIAGELVVQSASTTGSKVMVKIQTGNNDDGFYIYQEHDDITFKDFIFCPSLTNPFVDDMVKVDENSAVYAVTTPSIPNTITFDGCIFSDIDSAGDPFVESKADVIALNFPADINAMVSGSGRTPNDDLLKIWGDVGEFINFVLKDCVFFDPAARNIELYLDGTGGESGLIQDCLFANKPANIQYGITARARVTGSSMSIIGTQSPRVGDLTKCTASLESGGHMIYASSYGADAGTVDYTVKNFLGVNDGAGTVRPFSGGSEKVLIEDSIFCVKTGAANICDYPAVSDAFNRCTFYMPGAAAFIYSGTADPAEMTFTDCVIAGAGMGPYTDSNTGGDKLINCAIATTGADAITTIGTTLQQINCVLGDPGIISKDYKNANFMDTSDGSLFMAASDNGSIGGGANYTVADAGDNVENAFKSFGDCEDDIIKEASARASYKGQDMLDRQNPKAENGVIGNCLEINSASWARFEGSTDDIPIAFTGSDATLSMYYKIPHQSYSYPYVALRQSPTAPQTTGEAGDCANSIIWLKPTWIVDTDWHLFTPDISTLTWDTHSTVDLHINQLGTGATRYIYFDEIVLDDPNVGTGVADWGLY